MLYRNFAKPFFFKMDPEAAHHLVIGGLEKSAALPGGKASLRMMYGVPETPELAVDLFGLHFHTPVGLAAGLDKNAQAIGGFSSIGFGFMEVGTVTPKGQPGNEQPRLFRLPSDEALINRMGFNNEGADAMAKRLKAAGRRSIPVAVNIGKNKTTPNEEAHEDYRKCIRTLYPYGDFFVVNISSPNTPDLRSLQHGSELSRLLAEVKDEMELQHGKSGVKKNILVKIAPDVSASELEYMVDTIANAGVDGIIATNTTISRNGLSHVRASETGGLSGKPLRDRSTEIISAIYRQTGGQLPIIGSGGIFTPQDAYDKIKAGASLVEIYTALIYEGPEVNRRLHAGLRNLLRRDGFRHISEAVGVDVQ
ncbi:quinone-dependent dihydroorotate dehydrogenase [Paenibacillus sp. HN-1]|uniref:quinone-dependent dihydroorotate dehydrogenase n=1 Tax=Paenibacillus TaxID=44249 RepID=UPI001CA8BFB6|nr:MULTISPECIES: quinone-dependent dihydroorotate dehydrogenase [Paenibacillus]MBY9082463.1 quinone-dependent dihydroorotate dehydrogenase [Paenibacillus sp. CGMCC 1.18879]MBY9084822.1 quinone-dependent dihydroorotate dehydrogenase [Paenibacillus sinensis]